MIARTRIVVAARNWIGTPYHHQASLKGVGCDCLGLIRGVWRELQGPEPEALPPYTRDWGDVTVSEPLLAAARRHLVPVAVGEARPGDVVVFRMQAGVAKHAGILVEGSPGVLAAPNEARFVHAQEGIGVDEVQVSRWWRRHISAVFDLRRPRPGSARRQGRRHQGAGGRQGHKGEMTLSRAFISGSAGLN